MRIRAAVEKKNRLRHPRSIYIEYLEKRIAPATFIVNNLADAGPGSLRQAVINANANPGFDTIVFQGAATSGQIVLTGGEIGITDSVNIKGPGAGNLIIDAQNASRIFNINDGDDGTVRDVIIGGLSMVNGNTTGSGGGIFCRESLTLLNSVVSGCTAAEGGGGVYLYTYGIGVVKNCKITGNKAAGNVGGLYLGAEDGIQVINSLISGNTTAGNSGGLYARVSARGYGDILVDHCTIINNGAGGIGGGAGFDTERREHGVIVGKVTIRNSLIAGNTTPAQGGGVYLDDGRVLIDRCIITNNIAGDLGGGVLDSNLVSLTIRNSEIVNNRAATAGAGIYALGDPKLLIQRTLVSGNISADDGGGIFASYCKSTIQKSTISGNTAADGGGGIFGFGGSMKILNTTIRDNAVAGYGGGVRTAGTGDSKIDMQITGSLFTGNSADGGGGGLGVNSDGTIIISNSAFISNRAGTDGGGVYLRTYLGSISIRNSLIAQNTALDDAGGLALNFGATLPVTITHTLIKDNFAAGEDGGGVAILATTGSVTFTSCLITGNISTVNGGGIFTSSVLALNNTKITGNTAPNGPQIFNA